MIPPISGLLADFRIFDLTIAAEQEVCGNRSE